ncbi:MAG: hypothetical protein AVDCRST_MAG40-140, partial [uncultured Gemmatimonadaceae bacterium]
VPIHCRQLDHPPPRRAAQPCDPESVPARGRAGWHGDDGDADAAEGLVATRRV